MLEIIAWIVVFFAFVAGLVYLRVRENRYLKKKTREAIRPELLKEFEGEKQDALRRKAAFQDTLKKFSGPED
ncbi:hypothetical protein F9K50_00025 [bacterium]|nr:MAG: hypothetical protein F9K50_00025 [bacterium]